jgi:ABC-type Fe3+-siderophore transport system permease subunit
MIQDVTLRWVVTVLFVVSAGVYTQAMVVNRQSGADVIGNSLHAIMAVAMAVMAWPRGAELPTRAPMIFFLAAALWFAVITVRSAGHRVANGYHVLMMLAMSWMYAAMGGLKLRSGESDYRSQSLRRLVRNCI